MFIFNYYLNLLLFLYIVETFANQETKNRTTEDKSNLWKNNGLISYASTVIDRIQWWNRIQKDCPSPWTKGIFEASDQLSRWENVCRTPWIFKIANASPFFCGVRNFIVSFSPQSSLTLSVRVTSKWILYTLKITFVW